MKKLLPFLMLGMMLSSCAQTGSSGSVAVERDVSSVLYYIEKAPRIASDNPPLLILLHGLRSDENDLFALADHLPGEFRIVSARAPIELETGSYAWFHFDMVDGVRIVHEDEAEQSRIKLIQFIDQMSVKYKTAADKIYLMGFSQGAMMSYCMALTAPSKVNGILALSGGVLPSLKDKVKPNDELKKLQVFIAHGTDDDVLPLSRSVEAKALVESLGIVPSYHEYMGMEHSINREELLDINAWLKADIGK